MKLDRPTTDKDRRALKVSTQRSVSLAGGQASVAAITRVSQGTISDYANTGNERHLDSFMPIDVLCDLIKDRREAGEVLPLLTLLCEMAGGTFVRVPEPDRDTPAPDLELMAVGARHWAFPALISRLMAGEISQEDFREEASQLVPRLMNDLSHLKQQLLTVCGEDTE